MDIEEPPIAETTPAQAAVDEVAQLPDHYFELYTLAVEMADRLSARRLTANTFFVTVNTGLSALLGAHSFQWYVAVAGIILCTTWWALLKSYRDLNTAKFNAVINPMEARLPARIFSDEWAALHRDPVKLAFNRSAIAQWLGRYWELGIVERVVPVVFVLIYLLNLLSRI